MKKELHTDKIIREKLKDFSVAPPQHIFDNVQASLAAQKRKRRVAYISWISAAAVVLLAFIGGWYFNESQNGESIQAVQSEISTQDEMPQKPIEEQEQIPSTLNNSIKDSEKREQNGVSEIQTPEKNLVAENRKYATEQAVAEQPETIVNLSDTEIPEMEEATIMEDENAKIPAEENVTSSEKNITTTENLPQELSVYEKNLIAGNVQKVNETAQKQGSWKLGMNISPGYSSQVANHSDSYNQNMNYSGNNGNANVAGGISVQYKTAKRWSVESGVYYAKNGQKSETSFDLFAFNQRADEIYAPVGDSYFSNAVNVTNGQLQMNGTAGVVALNGTPQGAEVTTNLDESKLSSQNSLVTSGEFSQVFEFVEIPLLVRYRLIDAKFGLELLGGFNAGIVVGNDAYLDNEFGLQNVGKTEDISPINLSGTLGVGLNYELGKHISLGFEPRLNYYLSSINQNPDVEFRPYRIGFYTGIYYEF